MAHAAAVVTLVVAIAIAAKKENHAVHTASLQQAMVKVVVVQEKTTLTFFKKNSAIKKVSIKAKRDREKNINTLEKRWVYSSLFFIHQLKQKMINLVGIKNLRMSW